MNKREPAVNEITRHTVRGLAAELIKIALVWLWPIIAPALAVAAGYLANVSWLYVIVGAAVTFGAGATGALRFSELRVRIAPVNKLVFTHVTLSADFLKDKGGKRIALQRAQIGYQLQNLAHFPISFVIDDMHTSFEGMVNPKPDRPFRGTEVPPGNVNIYRDDVIPTKGMPLNKEAYEGNLKFRIRYGYVGNEKHVINRNLSLSFVIDNKTGASTITFWDVIES